MKVDVQPRPTINSSNIYIDLNKQGDGTLTGSDVDQKLVSAKVERVIAYADGFRRKINPASESSLLSAGEIDANPVKVQVLRTKISTVVQNYFLAATSIDNITIFVVDIINGKYTVTEEIVYKSCYITSFDTDVNTRDGEDLSLIAFTFRFNERQNTLFFFDQTGKPIGQNVSLVKFAEGTLAPSGGG